MANDEQTSGDPSEPESLTVFEAAGGWPYFEALVDHFYDTVQDDAVLRPLYPEDLTDARRHTALFLQQYWGGPAIYNEERGHPRLRMRHNPFVIGQVERDAWLAAMVLAVESVPMRPDLAEESTAAVRGMLNDYFDHASTAMINQA